MAPSEESWIGTGISEQTCSGAHVRHLRDLLELLQIRAGVSETFAIICDVSLSVLLAWLKETQVKIFAKKKCVMNRAPTRMGYIIEKFRIS